MWHWLHKNVQAVDPLVRTSIIFSVSLHLLCILLLVLLHYLQPTRQLTIQRNAPLTTEITIIIDPHAPVTGVVIPKPTQLSQSSTTTKTEQQKPATTVVSAPKAKPHPPSLKLRRTSATPRKTKKQKAKPEKSAKPKKEPTKKLTVDKPRKAAPEKQLVEQVKTQPVPEVPQATQLPASIDGPIMIARSSADATALAVQLEIQEELLRVWRPPVGIDEGISCVLKVTLDTNGVVQTLEIVKPSGIMLFDVSARAALQQAVWPRAFWGTMLELCLQ
jgi:outer membrane biosynthesis protein TonB